MIPDPQRPKSQEYLFHMERPSNLTSPIEQPQAKPHMYKVLFIETFLYVRCRTRILFFFEAFAALVNLIPFDIVLQTSAVLTMREVERHSMRLFSKGCSRRILNYRYNDSKRATGCFPLENMSLCRREIFEL